jgi:predicted secreted protein
VKKGLALDDIKVVTEQQVTILRDNGNFDLTADYSVKLEAVGNISLLLDFHPTSAK